MKLIRNLNKTIKIIISFIGLVIVSIGYAIMQAINLVFWIPVALLNNMRYRVVRSSIFMTIFAIYLGLYEQGKAYLQQVPGSSWNEYWKKIIASLKNMNLSETIEKLFSFVVIIICFIILIRLIHMFFKMIDDEICYLKRCLYFFILVFLDEITHSFSVIAYGTKKEREAAELIEFRKKYGPFETITDLLDKQAEL